MTDPTPQPPAWSAEESVDGMQDEMGMAQHLRLTPDQPQWIRWRTELGHLRAELSRRQQEIATLKREKAQTKMTLETALARVTAHGMLVPPEGGYVLLRDLMALFKESLPATPKEEA